MGKMRSLVRPRHDESDVEEQHPSSQSSEDEGSSGHTSDTEASDVDSRSQRSDQDDSSDDSDKDLGDDADTEPAVDHALKQVSFGALIQAQETLQPKSRKRKAPEDFDERTQSPENQPQDKSFDWKNRIKPPSRQSKHAPTILSSKQQVSRRRDIFEPSSISIKSRDPRFDPTVQQASNPDRNAVDKANRNYSFLSSYQATEILDLKTQIKKTKDPSTAADLKQRVMAIENQIRSVEAKQRSRDVENKHKQKERELIRTGQKEKPYYLKPSEIKKLAETERLEGMGKKARDKAVKRKEKREKTKDSRGMPRVRRE